MATLTNTGKQPIRASTGHIIMPGAMIEVDQATLDRFLAEPYMAGQVKRGHLVIEESEAQDEQETIYDRKWVAKAKKADLIDLLQSHSEEPLKGLNDLKADDLREYAIKLLFVDA